jgi:hypothetical protein
LWPAREMRGQILDVCLPPRAKGGRRADWQPALLYDDAGSVAIGRQLGLDNGLVVLAGSMVT